MALLLVGLALTARADLPRSYYGMTVLLNDSQVPTVRATLQLTPLIGNGSYPYWAETMTANVTLVSGLSWSLDRQVNGSQVQTQQNVSTATWFNYTLYVSPLLRANTTNASAPVFVTFTAVVVYTNNVGTNPWRVQSTVSFAVNVIPPDYVPPAPPPLISLQAAAIMGIGGAGTIGAGAYVLRRAKLQELYLMHDSGMLIRHWSRSGGVAHDSDIMSGMLIVLQEFVRDTWKSHQDEDAPLEQLRFGGQRVILARSSHSVLAAVVQGRYLNGLPRKLEETVQDFEDSNASVLANWNGNVDLFPKVDLIGRRFLPGDVRPSA